VPCQRNLGSLVEDNSGNRRRWYQQRSGSPVVAEIAGRVGGNDPGTLQRFRDVDAQDFGVRDLAAKKRDMQHARQFDVIDKQCLAGEQPAVLVAFDRLAECAR
jgi:hypothetical protein